jgi:hypothetical protein
MTDTELRFAKHVGNITHLLGGCAYTIHQIPENVPDAGFIQGALRAAWIVGEDCGGGKPDYDCDKIVSLTVARDGTTQISLGSLFEPIEESTRLYTLLLGHSVCYKIECIIGHEMKVRPLFASIGK